MYFCPKQGQDFKTSAAPIYPNMGKVPPPPTPSGRQVMISSVEFAVNHSSGSNIWRCTPSINILLSLTKVGRLRVLLTNITVLPSLLSTKALSIYVYKRMVSEKIIFGPIRKMNALRTAVEEASGSPTQYSSRNKLLTFWTLRAIQEIKFISCLASAVFSSGENDAK